MSDKKFKYQMSLDFFVYSDDEKQPTSEEIVASLTSFVEWLLTKSELNEDKEVINRLMYNAVRPGEASRSH